VSERVPSLNFHGGAEEKTDKDAPCLCRDSNPAPPEYKSNPLDQHVRHGDGFGDHEYDDLDDDSSDTDDVTMVSVLVMQLTQCLVTAEGVGSNCRRVTLWRSCRHFRDRNVLNQ
jgi:hypothetical protein